jgi:protein-disulfide isomerase
MPLMKKETIIITLVGAAVLAFLAGRFSAKTGNAPGAEVAAETVGAAAGGAAAGVAPTAMPQKGKADALVTIVISSDFQCPFCSRVEGALKEIEKTYPNDVRWVWANQPLPFHDKAKPAALAAMAAHRQGKFWQMHAKLFENQKDLSDENYDKWAKELGLDMAKFAADRKDAALGKQIDQETAAANQVGAGGTPSFLINGKLLQGAQPVDAFKKEIDEALAAAKKLQASGKKGAELAAAAFAERDPANGAKVFQFFIQGNLPAADAPAEPAREAAKEPEGPAQAPPDSFDIWKVPVDAKVDAVLGDSAKAQVTIVEFSDFQCPFCSRAAKTVDQLVTDYGDKVRVVFKHKPLPFHDKAKPASAAAIAAGKQGKFWEFYHKAFDNQQNLTDENFVAWAKELGLDAAKFDADRKSDAVAKQIAADDELAGTVGISGTPGFMINGRKVVGAQPVGVFKAVIDEELKKAGDKRGPGYYDEIIAKGKVWSDLSDEVKELKLDGLPFRGPKDAKVTITLFSDFQCPFCSRIEEPLKAAWEPRKDKVKIVFAHFPLSFHQWAKPASTAAQVAWEESPEKFWALHDALFANQKELSAEKIDELAKAAGVDMAKLKAAQESKKFDKFFDETMEMGTKAGVQGTPSIYVNGRKYEPQGGFDGLGKTIDDLLK